MTKDTRFPFPTPQNRKNFILCNQSCNGVIVHANLNNWCLFVIRVTFFRTHISLLYSSRRTFWMTYRSHNDSVREKIDNAPLPIFPSSLYLIVRYLTICSWGCLNNYHFLVGDALSMNRRSEIDKFVEFLYFIIQYLWISLSLVYFSVWH